jgi:hypothetical protein
VASMAGVPEARELLTMVRRRLPGGA